MAARGDIKNQDVEPILFEDWLKLNFDNCLEKAGAFSKIKSSDYFEQGEYPVIDQGEKYVSGFVNDKNLLYKGELPVIIFGDHTRIFKYVTNTFAVGADGTKILKPIKAFDPKFFFYYMKSLTVPSLGYSRHYKVLNSIEVPLPPFPEQQRIVAKLDILFGKLDKIKTHLERIPQLLKDFRQKVLTQAVTGKLTELWREGRELGEWKTEELGNVLKDVKYGTSKKSEYEIIGTPILRIPNIKDGEIDISDLKFTILDDKEYDSLTLVEGDILIIRSNGSVSLVGQSAIIRKDLVGYSYAGYLIIIKLNRFVLLPS